MTKGLSQFLILFGVCGAAFFAAYAPLETAGPGAKDVLPATGVSAERPPEGRTLHSAIRAEIDSAELPAPGVNGVESVDSLPDSDQKSEAAARSRAALNAPSESGEPVNPYAGSVGEQALDKVLPRSDDPIAKRIADHREKRFNSYLEQAALSTIDSAIPAGSLIKEKRPNDAAAGTRGSAAANPYERLKNAAGGADNKAIVTPEDEAAEAARRAERFASYWENAKRSQ